MCVPIITIIARKKMLSTHTCLTLKKLCSSQMTVVNNMCVPISQIMTIIGKNVIRASVDALCRDETGQISRDPHKNCLKTRRERLPSPSKQTKSHSWAGIQLSTCQNALYAPPVLCARIRSHAISRNLCHHHHHHNPLLQ